MKVQVRSQPRSADLGCYPGAFSPGLSTGLSTLYTHLSCQLNCIGQLVHSPGLLRMFPLMLVLLLHASVSTYLSTPVYLLTPSLSVSAHLFTHVYPLTSTLMYSPLHSCVLIKRPASDACLCMGDLQAPLAPHFVFLITL